MRKKKRRGESRWQILSRHHISKGTVAKSIRNVTKSFFNGSSNQKLFPNKLSEPSYSSLTRQFLYLDFFTLL